MKRYESSVMVSAFLVVLSAAVGLGSVDGADYGRIEVITDTWGVPNIFAVTDEGAMYGLGYVTARDRGFQMHLSSRLMQGRLAELIGEKPKMRRPQDTAVTSDRKARTFGWYRAAKTAAAGLDDDSRALLAAYCHGVNDYFDRHGDKLHGMYAHVGLRPEKWTPADCIVTWWHMGQFFGTDGTRDLIRWRNDSGRGRTRGLPPGDPRLRRPPNVKPDESAAVVRREDVTQAWIDRVNQYLADHGFDQPHGALKPRGEGPKFSHAWVVGGKKTTTGSSVLVSDPQTPVTNPSLFYEYHVKGKTFNARGMGVAGSPIILIGFTDKVAWGVTALGADQADLFRLKTDPQRPNEYEVDGKWRPMDVRRETIKVKGGDDQEIEIRETIFGPVITAFAYARPDDGEVAVKRIPLCETDRETIQGALAMLRADNVKAFGEALTDWRFPSANIVFGDHKGDIGYWTGVAAPLRSAVSKAFLSAHDGSHSDNDWQGIVPHDLLPHVINPKRGYIYSGNHMPVGTFYHIPIGASTGSQGDTIRSWRLRELLAAKDKFTPEDVLAMHYDRVNPSLRGIVRLGYHLRDTLKVQLAPDTRRALKYLQGWRKKGSASDNEIRGTELATRVNTFFRMMATDLAFDYGGGQTGLARFLRETTKRIEADPKAKLNDKAVEFIDRAIGEAWGKSINELGPDPEMWPQHAFELSARQTLGYFQSLDGFGSLNREHDLPLPPLRCSDGNTINSNRAQSYTQWVPMNDPDKAKTILPIGSSEDPGSPLRANLMKMWSAGELHPAPLSRRAVEAHRQTTEQLRPSR